MDAGIIFFRFSNIFKLHNFDFDTILRVVHTLKSESTLELSCDTRMPILTTDGISSQVKAVEQMLKIESSDKIINSFTNEGLKTAAEVFLYLISCPDELFKSLSLFYKDLFLTQPADQIILTLNRMTKSKTSQDQGGKLRAEKLLQRLTKIFPLKHEEIERLLPVFRNESINDFKIHNNSNSNGIDNIHHCFPII